MSIKMQRMFFRKAAVVATALAAFCVFADNWVYDPNGHIDYLDYTGGVVSDGTWTFKATVSGSSIKFGAIATNVYPEVVTAIDFSKPVVKKDDTSTTYTITELNEGFGFYQNGQPVYDLPGAWGRLGWRPACFRVGEITLPPDSLAKIGNHFFCQCTNATLQSLPATITSFGIACFKSCAKVTLAAEDFPSDVVTISDSAFTDVNMSGDLQLPSIKTIGGNAFANTKLTSVSCGPDLVSISGNWHAGAFWNCTSLTNVTFDPASSPKLLEGGIFGQCTALSSIDLTSVTNISVQNESSGAGYSHFIWSHVAKCVFGPNLKRLSAWTFADCTTIDEVHFYGMPPEFVGGKVLRGANKTGMIVTYVHLDENDADYSAQKTAWDALTEGGEILSAGSYWKSSLVDDVSYTTRLLILYKEKEHGELGHWIYDDRCSPAVVSNGVWTFEASAMANILTFGAFVSVPNEPEEIDFSKSISDYEGAPYVLGAIDTHFGGKSGTFWDGAYGKEGAEKVKKIIFPADDQYFVTIGEYAFCGCVNCEEIVNCVPDSVTSIGQGAFALVKMSQGDTDIRLYGISYLNYGVFTKVPVTSVVFGPSLKGMACHYYEMAFMNNTALTNVTFDAGMSAGYIGGATYGPFAGCSSLKRLDLSGFSLLPNGNNEVPWGACSGVGEVVFGTNATRICSTFFSGFSSLSNIVFNCPPPTDLKTPFLNLASLDSHRITTSVPRKWLNVENANGKTWRDYAANGEIKRRGSTWAAEYIREGVDVSNRPLVSPDAASGLLIYCR